MSDTNATNNANTTNANTSNQFINAVNNAGAQIFTHIIKPTAQAAIAVPIALATNVRTHKKPLVIMVALALAGYAAWTKPPVQVVEPGQLAVRINKFTGTANTFTDGTLFVMPGIHTIRNIDIREQVYRPAQEGNADTFQSIEGLSLGVDLTVRYALDSTKIALHANKLPADINGQLVAPAIQGVIHKTLAKYTVREIFSSKRGEIQKIITTELGEKLAQDGVTLRMVEMGKVNLPSNYKVGMESLLSEELASEKMRYTLDLKAQQVKETELDAEGQRLKREKLAQASANEQIIAAKAQEEAMKHVIPFKEKQIAQRQLEAEADKQSRIRIAEGSAQARRIEASGEADSRQKLADAEAYRLDRVGRVASEQMAREGALITKHPLLVQKAMVDKLSDKITVVIAPPGTDGKFLGSAITGDLAKSTPTAQVAQRNVPTDTTQEDSEEASTRKSE
jgi:regulator of protease activity HflC (stomatin/prohibitin superfamily)